MSAFTRGLGTKLYHSPDDVTYTQIANVVGLTPPSATRQSISVSDLDDAWERKATGGKAGGQLRATLRFSTGEATHDTVYDELADADNAYWKVEYADATEHVVEGFLTEWNPQDIGRDGDVQVQIAVEVDDDVSYPA